MKTKVCPHCSSEIDAKAYRCRYCRGYVTKKPKLSFWKTALLVILVFFLFTQYENLVVKPRKEKERQAVRFEAALGQISWAFDKDSIRQVFDDATKTTERGYIIDNLEAYMTPYLDSIKQAEDARIDRENMVTRIKSLNLELASMKKFDVKGRTSSLNSIISTVDLFKQWLTESEDCRRSDNNELKDIGDKMYSLLKSIQISSFPVLRKEYG